MGLWIGEVLYRFSHPDVVEGMTFSRLYWYYQWADVFNKAESKRYD
jgi:hypothetical protein